MIKYKILSMPWVDCAVAQSLLSVLWKSWKTQPMSNKKNSKKENNTFLNTYKLISGYLAKISNKGGMRKDFSTV